MVLKRADKVNTSERTVETVNNGKSRDSGNIGCKTQKEDNQNKRTPRHRKLKR